MSRAAGPFTLEGRRAVVTGVSRGIGRAIAIALAKAGADVAGIDLEDAGETATAVERAGRRAVFVTGTTADSGAIERLAATAVSKLGGIDIWVNNAARLLAKPLLETSDDDWHDLLGPNLNGYFYGCRAAARAMLAQDTGGSIVNISSVSSIVGVGGIGAYTAAKGAIAALTKALAVEVAKYDVRVNAVAPGAIDTPINNDVYTAEVRSVYNQRIPLGRIGVPEEVADVVVFLATPAARYLTGQQLVVDGGLIIDGTVGHQAADRAK